MIRYGDLCIESEKATAKNLLIKRVYDNCRYSTVKDDENEGYRL